MLANRPVPKAFVERHAQARAAGSGARSRSPHDPNPPHPIGLESRWGFEPGKKFILGAPARRDEPGTDVHPIVAFEHDPQNRVNRGTWSS